jgi:VanZ family protein
MNKILDIVPRWVPALLMMLIIFGFSSRTSKELPDFQSWDYFVKKSAHAIVYGLLALSYLRALPKQSYFWAWLFAILYAATDEFHQSFVPGRHASPVDVLLFDNLGAMITLFLHYRFYGAKHEKETY